MRNCNRTFLQDVSKKITAQFVCCFIHFNHLYLMVSNTLNYFKIDTLLSGLRSDFGTHWESDQNIVTAQLLRWVSNIFLFNLKSISTIYVSAQSSETCFRLGICSVPQTNPLNKHFIREEEKDLIGLRHFFLSSICFCD